MLRQRRLASVAVLTALLISPSGAQGSTIGALPYRDEGYFVEVPGAVGGLVTAVPGAVVGGAVCLPYALLNSQKGVARVLGGCTLIIGAIAGVVGYTVVGAPFYAVKKVGWDLPMRALGFAKAPTDE